MDELEKVEQKLSKKDYFVISSMLFALFFGAGNLIFPLHLGQIAGHNWLQATAGFVVTAVILPLLSILAIALTHSEGVYDVGLPVSTMFATAFMVLIHATIGPFFGTPRTASVSFTVGIAPFVPKQYQGIGLLIFSFLFFSAAFYFSYQESDILANLGKLLNPIFLVLLFLVFLVAFISPMGNPNNAAATTLYRHADSAFMNGFLEGYNTMDALAGLAFGVTVVRAIRQMGRKEDKMVAVVTAKSGFFSMGSVALIYLLLIVVGAMSLGRFKAASDGGVAFSQIVQSYAGAFGQAILAAMIVLTCLTTAVGLVAAFAQDFHSHFPQLSYHGWLAISCFAAFAVANLGLNTIISWSQPVLMFLYPLAIVLILLSVFSPLFHKDRAVYCCSILLTIIPAFFDMIVAMPEQVSRSNFGIWIASIRQCIPLASQGFSWLLPMLIGFALGLVIYFWGKRHKIFPR